MIMIIINTYFLDPKEIIPFRIFLQKMLSILFISLFIISHTMIIASNNNNKENDRNIEELKKMYQNLIERLENDDNFDRPYVVVQNREASIPITTLLSKNKIFLATCSKSNNLVIYKRVENKLFFFKRVEKTDFFSTRLYMTRLPLLELVAKYILFLLKSVVIGISASRFCTTT